MSNNIKQRNQTILFYVVLVYVFAFLFWWSYLLYNKTGQHFEDVVKLKKYEYVAAGNAPETFLESTVYQEEQLALKKEKRMIVTEGLVFFLILGFGMATVRRSFMKEVEIARQQRNFILSITHELKSPLSSIKLMSETLIHRDLDKTTQNKLLQNTLEESNRLETLVENILLAAKIENKQYGFSNEHLNFSDITNTVADQFSIAKNKRIVKEIAPNISINGDKSAITSIVINLMENALKYAPESPFIAVTLKNRGNQVVMQVIDEGNGIPDEEKTKIFEKFYRIGNEDTRQAKGTGLGLYIVSELVRFHNGTINVLDNQPKGAIFSATFNV